MPDTELIEIFDPQKDFLRVERAAALLRDGKTVIIPTETVYGLAADACNPDAVKRIFEAKGRPQDNPLIVHVSDFDQIAELVTVLPDQARLLAEHFWPGPLTMILPKSEKIPLVTSGGLDTVAVRLPENAVARAIIRAAGTPLAAPSANRSGSPSPTTVQHCIDDMWGRVDAIVASNSCTVGVESTVISLCGAQPVLLRPGRVTLEQLREVVGTVQLDRGVTERLSENSKVLSPGMKYKHYSPRADVVLLNGNIEQYAEYLMKHCENGEYAVCFKEDIPYLAVPFLSYGAAENHLEQAACIFDVLRSLDKLGVSRAYVHAPHPDGVGLAVYNRLIRAAGFEVINLGQEEP